MPRDAKSRGFPDLAGSVSASLMGLAVMMPCPSSIFVSK